MAHGIPSIPLGGPSPSGAAGAGPRASGGEVATFDNLTDGRLEDFLRGGSEAGSGERVSPESALRVGTAYGCVRLISGAVANLPLELKRRVDGKRRLDADDHPLWTVLRKKPNPWQTPSQFRRYLQACVLLRKGGFARIVRSGRRVLALLPLHPDRVEVGQNPDLTLRFRYTRPDGVAVEIPQSDMFYLCGMTLDGVKSLSVLSYARETVGEAMTTARQSANLFRNGTAVGGVLASSGKLTDPQIESLRQRLEAYRGASNAGKNLILQDGIPIARPSSRPRPDAMTYLRLEAPAELPVSLAELKAHLRREAEDTFEDALLEAYLAAAVDHLDGRGGLLGRCLVEQEWQLYSDGPRPLGTGGVPDARGFRLELGPVRTDAPIAIEYRAGGAWLAVDPDHVWIVPESGGRARLEAAPGRSWPSADAVGRAWRVTFRAGHEAGEVPAAIRAAILLLAADLHSDRSGKTAANLVTNPTVDRLLDPYRQVSV